MRTSKPTPTLFEIDVLSNSSAGRLEYRVLALETFGTFKCFDNLAGALLWLEKGSFRNASDDELRRLECRHVGGGSSDWTEVPAFALCEVEQPR